MGSEEPTCDLCGGSSYVVIREPDPSSTATVDERLEAFRSSGEEPLVDQLIQCTQCTLVFVWPRMESERISQAYSSAIDPVHANQDRWRVASFERQMRKVGVLPESLWNLPTKPRLLDIGCAGGAFPCAANKLGFDVTGIEPASYLASAGRERYSLDIRDGFFDPRDFAGERFQVVSLWDVLEHLDSPSAMLRNVHKVLEGDGLLILNLPMIDTLSARILGSRWPFYLNVHLYYFTLESISKMLESTGYVLETYASYQQSLSLDYVLYRASLVRRPSLPILHRISARYQLGQRTLLCRKAG